MKQRNLISARERSAQYAVDSRGGIPSLFLPHHVACGILVPWPGTEPEPSAERIWSPNHWTTRDDNFKERQLNIENLKELPVV